MKGETLDEEELPRRVVHEIVNPRWEVCVTASSNGFKQSSFVNSIATTKVQYNAILTCIMAMHLGWYSCSGCCDSTSE